MIQALRIDHDVIIIHDIVTDCTADFSRSDMLHDVTVDQDIERCISTGKSTRTVASSVILSSEVKADQSLATRSIVEGMRDIDPTRGCLRINPVVPGGRMSFTSVVVVLNLNRTSHVGPTTLSQITDCRTCRSRIEGDIIVEVITKEKCIAGWSCHVDIGSRPRTITSDLHEVFEVNGTRR